MRSRQWKVERDQGHAVSSCVTILLPYNKQQDGSVNIVIDRQIGFEIGDHLDLERLTWS